MKLGYLLIAVSFAANANCRVAGKDIVCDNSNTVIDTYWMINRQVQPLPVFIVNQPIQLPQIRSTPPEYDPVLIKQLNINETNSENIYGIPY